MIIEIEKIIEKMKGQFKFDNDGLNNIKENLYKDFKDQNTLIVTTNEKYFDGFSVDKTEITTDAFQLDAYNDDIIIENLCFIRIEKKNCIDKEFISSEFDFLLVTKDSKNNKIVYNLYYSDFKLESIKYKTKINNKNIENRIDVVGLTEKDAIRYISLKIKQIINDINKEILPEMEMYLTTDYNSEEFKNRVNLLEMISI